MLHHHSFVSPFAGRKRIVELASKNRFPAIYFQKEFVDEALTRNSTVAAMSFGSPSREGYLRLVPMLHAGKSSEDSIATMKFIQDSDFEFYGGLLQGMLGANPHHEPQIGFDRVQSAEDRFLFGPDGRLVYQIGHVFRLQMHIVHKQNTRGLFLGDFFATEEKGPRCLNKLLPELLRTRL